MPKSVAGTPAIFPAMRSPWIATIAPSRTACRRSSASASPSVLNAVSIASGSRCSSNARVCGCTPAARARRLEVLAPRERPLRNHAHLAKAAGVAEAPGEVPEDAVAAKKVRERPRAGKDRLQIAHHAAADGRPQQEKRRPERDDGRLDPRRHVESCPAEEPPPENAAH